MVTKQEPSDQLRAGHEDRERASEELGRHYAAGRLTMAELEDRQGAAWAARTLGELHELYYDLPPLRPDTPPNPTTRSGLPPSPWAGPPALGTGSWPAPIGSAATAPYGIDPQTGRPWSDKQRVTAGVLQLLLGSLGVGRFYAGNTGVGVAQLLLTLLSFGLLLPVTLVWGLIDGVLMLTGSGTDRFGRPLR